jgi:choline-sulfatase
MKKPNFLIIMSDEHDPMVSTPYAHPFVRTPNMQRLADAGATFEHAYCNSPLCVPSRASFMTGKHLFRTGAWDNSVPLATEEPTWAHRLNAAGYETCLAGKMHFIGPDQLHGFKRRIMSDIHGMGQISNNLPDWSTGRAPGGRNMRERLLKEPGARDYEHMQYDEEVIRRSVSYLAEPARREQPWALCTSIFTPHFPFIVRPEYFYYYYPKYADVPGIPQGHLEEQHPQIKNVRRYFDCDDIPEEQVRIARAAYYGLVEFADEQIGILLDALQANGLADDTIVIYIADHGESLGQHGLWYKCTFYEPSARIPLIVRWPGTVQAGSRYRRVTSLLDVVSTMLEVAGADREFTDGDSLLPLLAGVDQDSDGMALAEYEGHGVSTVCRMVRRGPYKLNYYHGERPELYDLDNDPHEFDDRSADPEYANVVNELTEIALDGWDAQAIYDRVVRSQRERRITAKGLDRPWSPPWRNGKYG